MKKMRDAERRNRDGHCDDGSDRCAYFVDASKDCPFILMWTKRNGHLCYSVPRFVRRSYAVWIETLVFLSVDRKLNNCRVRCSHFFSSSFLV